MEIPWSGFEQIEDWHVGYGVPLGVYIATKLSAFRHDEKLDLLISAKLTDVL